MNLLPGVPNIESPFFDSFFKEDDELYSVATSLRDNGYAVIEFPEPDFDQIANKIIDELTPQYDFEYWKSHGAEAGVGLRLQDAWRVNSNVKRLATNEKIISILTKLFGRKAWPFQTLNFPVGTQQHFHSDMVHFSSSPERFMAGVWIALEDIDETNGPLVYYPKSHKLPFYSNEQIGICAAKSETIPSQSYYEPLWKALIEIHDLKPLQFHAKKGQALIWLANVLHGGAKQIDRSRTRWSQVNHYYFEDCSYYKPMNSDIFFGNINFMKMPNVMNNEVVNSRYCSHEVPQDFIELTNLKLAGILPYDFDAAKYLELNPDVATSGVDAKLHYLQFGKLEGRKF